MSVFKYRTPERIEYQLHLANKMTLWDIIHEKYRIGHRMKEEIRSRYSQKQHAFMIDNKFTRTTISCKS